MSNFVWSSDKGGTIKIAGKSLEYVCFGPAPDKAFTLILLHEGLGCVQLWRDFPQELAKATGCGVFVVSRAGYGHSDPVDLPRPVDYMTHEATQILPQILDHIGFQKGVLLGHSDGATIAAIYAGSLEDHRVRGLILMAPHFFTEAQGLEEISKAKLAYDEGDLKTRLAKYHDDPDNAFRGWNDAWLYPDFKNWDVGEMIDYFRVPVLAIQGKDDPYGSYAQIREIADRIYSPLDIVMLDDCNHSPHIDQSKKTMDAIADYIYRLQRIETAMVKMA